MRNPLYVSPSQMQDDTYDRDLSTLERVDTRQDQPERVYVWRDGQEG